MKHIVHNKWMTVCSFSSNPTLVESFVKFKKTCSDMQMLLTLSLLSEFSDRRFDKVFARHIFLGSHVNCRTKGFLHASHDGSS